MSCLSLNHIDNFLYKLTKHDFEKSNLLLITKCKRIKLIFKETQVLVMGWHCRYCVIFMSCHFLVSKLNGYPCP